MSARNIGGVRNALFRLRKVYGSTGRSGSKLRAVTLHVITEISVVKEKCFIMTSSTLGQSFLHYATLTLLKCIQLKFIKVCCQHMYYAK